jgi:DNA invertase Pin-like site-specific DNA recombinase
MTSQHKSVAIYARVSTDKQKVDMQLNELRDFIKRSGWSIYREFIDEGYTGSNIKRPAFTEMLYEAKKRKFDILLVWKLDRLSRSLKDFINTPTGKLVFQIIGAVAEFEKDIIRERVVAGLDNARQKGKHLGRPKIHDGILAKAKELRKRGLSFRKIEKQLGVGEGTIRKKLKDVAI